MRFLFKLRLHKQLGENQRIISFLGISEVPNDKSYLIIMEYADSGSLQEFLNKEKDILQWNDKLSLAQQLAEGIAYMHGRNIAHRDLHNKNILIHKRQIKIADFGLSKNLNSMLTTQTPPILGILPYVEPNAIANCGYRKDKRSDIYSIGILLWEISSYRQPFDDLNDQMEIYTYILKGAREAPIPNTPTKYMELYKRCWETNPVLRPQISEIVARLSTMELEPVYNLSSQVSHLNNSNFNGFHPSISAGRNLTIVFDENLEVPIKSKELSHKYGNCSSCECGFTDEEWCHKCESEKFRKLFPYWTSGNNQIDGLIRESQLSASHMSSYIEWIEYEQLKDIKPMRDVGYSMISSAIWDAGPREEFDEATKQWIRSSNFKVVVKSTMKASDQNLSKLLNERPSVTELLGIITAWNNHSRDENQFNSADRKTRGRKKHRHVDENTNSNTMNYPYSSKLISSIPHNLSVKYSTGIFNFDEDGLSYSSKLTFEINLHDL
ncbi:kinase-like protein [Gigaspora margarita]|uniref:Kinase-like protein n=1 Tax=Gigaspora margarita TaxID=4874 RepID=A0A8H3X5C3_GIGMA|nr:kinase-like protein [Gigaspora margarita]